jgi:hypothetical protein
LPATGAAARAHYDRLLNQSCFGKVLLPQLRKARAPVLATWDDHDYGVNNGDSSFVHKKETQTAFLDFLNVPQDSPRRSREGVYHNHSIQSPNGNHSVMVILLDARYHKDPAAADFLGSDQWHWLEHTLWSSTADVHLIVSGIQTLPQVRLKQESWAEYPLARQRLLDVVLNSEASAPVFLSGDVHFAELNEARCRSSIADVKLPEVTSSGITHAWTGPVGSPPFVLSWLMQLYFWLVPIDYNLPGSQYLGVNFAELAVDWDSKRFSAQVFDHEGAVRSSHSWELAQMAGGASNHQTADRWNCVPHSGRQHLRASAVNMMAVLAGSGIPCLLICAAVKVVLWCYLKLSCTFKTSKPSKLKSS